jgi:hypothetical protein
MSKWGNTEQGNTERESRKTDNKKRKPDKADRKRARISRRMDERAELNEAAYGSYHSYRITPMNRRRLAGGFAVILLLMEVGYMWYLIANL